MDIKKLSEAALAAVPADATGLLIMKITGALSAEDHNVIMKYMNDYLAEAKIKCTFVGVSVRDDAPFDFTLQHLTNEELREIGFQPIYSEFI